MSLIGGGEDADSEEDELQTVSPEPLVRVKVL